MNRETLPGNVLGYVTLRLAMGMSMLIHGVARFPKTQAFVDSTVKMFAESPLPPWVVSAFARITPSVEFLIGTLMILGLGTRLALTLGGLWMVVLIFGSSLIEKFDVVGIQLLYSLIFFHLLQNIAQNKFAVDRLMAKQPQSFAA